MANQTPPFSSPYPSHHPPLSIPLTVLADHPCPYLPNRIATSRAFWAPDMPGDLYHRFMNAAFRRSGRLIYQPICRHCRQCTPLRVPVANFTPDKSQRRCRRRNADLSVDIADPTATDEKFDLYRRYAFEWHGKADEQRDSFESFLYDSPVQTLEFSYRDPANKLLAIGICDVCPESLSSVYFYFDPAESRRGLGTFGALIEIQAAARLNIPHYYLGYWVNGCQSMQYKSTFRPCETLTPQGQWTPCP